MPDPPSERPEPEPAPDASASGEAGPPPRARGAVKATVRELAIATAMGPVAVASLLASRHARTLAERVDQAEPPGGHEEAVRPGAAAPPAAGNGSGSAAAPAGAAADGTGRYAARTGDAPDAAVEADASTPVGHAGAAGAAPGDPRAPEPPAGGGGVHAGRDIRVENQGSGAAVGQAHIVNNYQLTQTAVRLPYRIGRVPALASPFQERDIPGIEGGDSLVLAGMFGTGKTQLAARQAESAWDSGELHLLLWADASSREAVLSAYARAGQDLLGRTYADVADGAQAFLNWLRPAGGTQPHPWLVVLDGVTDPAHLAGLWPPASPGGRVLVTSSRADFEGAGSPRVVRIRPFTYDEILAYLERALELNPAARRAVEQAGASDSVFDWAKEIANGGLPLDTYLDTRLGARAGTASGGTGAPPTPVERSVEAAAALGPAGTVRAVLALIALLDNEGCLEDVLFTQAARQQVEVGRRWATRETQDPAPMPGVHRLVTPSPPVDEAEVRAALHALDATGVVDLEEHGAVRLVRISRPVRQAGRQGAPRRHGPERWPLPRALRDAVAAAWPDVERGMRQARSLWNAVHALEYTGSRIDGRNILDLRGRIHPLVFRYGESLGAWGRCEKAQLHLRSTAWRASRTLGKDHPDVLKALAQAARWQAARGDDFGAAEQLAAVLEQQRQAPGADPADVLTTRHHLARAQLSAIGWDAPGPRAELASVLRDRAELLGPDHADTLATVAVIVGASLGWSPEAALVGEDVTAAAELLLPSDRIDDFTAQELTTALHTELRRVAGEDHPETIDALRLLAGTHINLGEDDEALALSERALADAVRALGPEHPVTLDCKVTAALAAYNSGSDTADEAALQALADEWGALLGRDHPGALGTRVYVLGVSALKLLPGDRAAFADACADLLADTERVFGADHRSTRRVLSYTAELYTKHPAGDIAALVALSDLAARSARVPGPDHPDTLAVRLRLAVARGRAGDTFGALTALAALHGDCAHALDAEHPVTLDVRHELALCRGKAGDTPGAVSDLTRLLRDHEHLDGPDAEPTRAVRASLEILRPEE